METKGMDLSELNERVSSIVVEINKIKEHYHQKIKPYEEKIESLNEEYLDGLLRDSDGNVIKKGMKIFDAKGNTYIVLRRYQQHLFNYLGNAQLEVLKSGNKRSINISYRELVDYKISKTE